MVNWKTLLRLLHFQVEMSENGGKNKLGDTKTTNKIPLMFVDVKELTERYRRNKK